MTYIISKPSQTKTVPESFVAQTVKKRSSIAQGFLVQEGRSQEAEGRREESLYSKVFNLFSVVGYFCRAALVDGKLRLQVVSD